MLANLRTGALTLVLIISTAHYTEADNCTNVKIPLVTSQTQLSEQWTVACSHSLLEPYCPHYRLCTSTYCWPLSFIHRNETVEDPAGPYYCKYVLDRTDHISQPGLQTHWYPGKSSFVHYKMIRETSENATFVFTCGTKESFPAYVFQLRLPANSEQYLCEKQETFRQTQYSISYGRHGELSVTTDMEITLCKPARLQVSCECIQHYNLQDEARNVFGLLHKYAKRAEVNILLVYDGLLRKYKVAEDSVFKDIKQKERHVQTRHSYSKGEMSNTDSGMIAGLAAVCVALVCSVAVNVYIIKFRTPLTVQQHLPQTVTTTTYQERKIQEEVYSNSDSQYNTIAVNNPNPYDALPKENSTGLL